MEQPVVMGVMPEVVPEQAFSSSTINASKPDDCYSTKSLPGVWNNIAGIGNDLKKKNIQVQTVLDKRIVNNGVIWRCGLTPDGSFTVNALRSRWDYRTPLTNKNFHWIKEIPLKVSCFIWRAQWGRIPTAKELVKRGVNMENLTCQMCNVKEETADHILVDCAYAKKVMEGVMRWCKVHTHMEDLQAVSDVLNLANKWGTCTKKRKIFLVICYSTLWRIWIARNEKVFKRNRLPPEKVIEYVKLVTFLWVKNKGIKMNLIWANWSQCPFFF
ncbi:unnamed protein product [Lactuca virosa]|uniref:Reverse transcriptase zinc-binding domain-containing protein n=1 Tax=Lactuca virosa TaxID=75947 RepID=A0AAU9P4T6_9ASTR|nr:unnamed protein product [Lactuca virosa]